MEINPILKHIGSSCNLGCKYCFYSRQEREENVLMELDVLERITQEVCKHNPETAEIRFFWHGGEPLLADTPFYEKAIELQNQLRKPGQKIKNGIVTNGTLINNEWANFFKEKEIELVVSLDGPKEYHDQYRRYQNGRGSFEEVIEGVRILKEAGIEPNILSVINKGNVLAAGEMFDFFISRELSNFVNFVPALGIRTEKGISFGNSISPSLYINFLIEIFDFWIDGEKANFKILPLESIVRAFLGFPQEDCRFSGECRKNIVVDYNGDIFACSTYGYGEFFKFGNIKDGIDSVFDLENSHRYKRYLQYLQGIKEKCSKCWWYKICQGGCPFWHYLGKSDNIFCKDLMRLFRHIQQRLRDYQMIP